MFFFQWKKITIHLCWDIPMNDPLTSSLNLTHDLFHPDLHLRYLPLVHVPFLTGFHDDNLGLNVFMFHIEAVHDLAATLAHPDGELLRRFHVVPHGTGQGLDVMEGLLELLDRELPLLGVVTEGHAGTEDLTQ